MQDARRRPARTFCRKEGEGNMRRLNTRPYSETVMRYAAMPAAKLRSAKGLKPWYETFRRDNAEVKETYMRTDIATALQDELERRFIALCEAIYLDEVCNTYRDVAMITEAVARYKEVFVIMDLFNVPPNFIYNTPAAYCDLFHLDEADVEYVIAQNGEYMANNNGMPAADTMKLPDYLAELNDGNF